MQIFIMLGRVGRDLELKYTSNNKRVVDFAMADTKKDITTWINCRAWENNAENICKYVKKGDRLQIQGEIRNDKYTNKDGIEKTYTYVLIDKFWFVESKKDNTQEISNVESSNEISYENEELDFYDLQKQYE